MNSPEKFDRDYFEDGVRTRKSLYEDYRWMPWVSLPMANAIKQMYPGKTIIDYGCGRGFLVHALRLLGVDAWGFDISKYAIQTAKAEAIPYVCNEVFPYMADIIIIKDVLEHLYYETFDGDLKQIRHHCTVGAFIIVPLGEDGRYRIRDYHFDSTNIIIEDEEWWLNKFRKVGFTIKEFRYNCPPFKQHWVEKHPYGNGFFWLEK
jgi:SAM-dependent methyltransferase